MARLLGAAPGLIGYDEGGKSLIRHLSKMPLTQLASLGQLTEAVRRRPYGVDNDHSGLTID